MTAGITVDTTLGRGPEPLVTVPPPTAAWMRISELSRRVGVSAETLRAWERRYGVLAPRRTVGNTRLYSNLDEARVRLMQRYIGNHMPVAQAAELARAARLTVRAGPRDAVPEHERRRALVRLRTALAAYDEGPADAALGALLGAYAVPAVLRDVVLPYMAEVGDRWAAEQASVAEEHFTTNFMLTRVMSLARGWDRGLGPRAVLAAAPGDPHVLGLMCFGIALHGFGWRITCLGAATPVATLAGVARATEPTAIVVSCSLTGALADEQAALGELAARWSVALAGPAIDPALAAACGGRYLAGDAIEAAAVVAEV